MKRGWKKVEKVEKVENVEKIEKAEKGEVETRVEKGKGAPALDLQQPSDSCPQLSNLRYVISRR